MSHEPKPEARSPKPEARSPSSSPPSLPTSIEATMATASNLRAQRPLSPKLSGGPLRCRRKFLRFFPAGFRDETYIDWERGYKWTAHEQWQEQLGRAEFRRFLAGEQFAEIAARAVRVES